MLLRVTVAAIAILLGFGSLRGISPPPAHAAGGTITAGDVIVSDNVHSRVDEYKPDGTLVQTLVNTGEAGLQSPYGTAFDAAGNLFVADFNGNQILKRTPTGAVTVFSNDTILGNGNLYQNPESIAFSPDRTKITSRTPAKPADAPARAWVSMW